MLGSRSWACKDTRDKIPKVLLERKAHKTGLSPLLWNKQNNLEMHRTFFFSSICLLVTWIQERSHSDYQLQKFCSFHVDCSKLVWVTPKTVGSVCKARKRQAEQPRLGGHGRAPLPSALFFLWSELVIPSPNCSSIHMPAHEPKIKRNKNRFWLISALRLLLLTW